VTEDLAPQVHDAYILKEITGSDHVPLGIVIKKAWAVATAADTVE
jgi:exonuclease III